MTREVIAHAGDGRDATAASAPSSRLPLAKQQLDRILRGALDCGACSVAFSDRGGHVRAQARPRAAQAIDDRDEYPVRQEATAPVIVRGEEVGVLHVLGHSVPAADRVARLTATWLADVWSAAEEADSLAGEIVHTYEEIHLLDELGETLSDHVDLPTIAKLVLKAIVSTLGGTCALLELADSGARFPYAQGVLDPPTQRPVSVADSHGRELATDLRSGGSLVGTIAVWRGEDAQPFTSSDGQLLHAVGELAANVVRNAELNDQLRRQSAALYERESHLRAVLDNVDDGILTVDDGGRIASFNNAAARIFGYQVSSPVGLEFDRVVFERERESGAVITLRDPRRTGAQSTEGRSREWVGRRRDGTTFPADVTIGQMTLGASAMRIVSVRDVTEQRRLEDELARQYKEARYLADRDSVTGLLNHRAVHQRLGQELARCGRFGEQVSILIVDIDGFKLFNDTYGHPVGDKVLQHVAARLVACSRQSDVVARYGGDEFVALLPGTGREGAVAAAERIASDLTGNPYRVSAELALPIRASIGVSTYPDNGVQLNDLVASADANLYESKLRGGDIVVGEASPPDGQVAGMFGVLEGLVTMVDNRDHYTRKHSDGVTAYALEIAEALGLSDKTQRTVRIAGLLHDVGKIGVPDRILRKPGSLNEYELQVIRQHVQLGEMIVKEVPDLPDVIGAVASHHERLDGLGYPRGLKGDEIPLLGRILAVADAYSAMTTDRPYRRAKGPDEAQAELVKAAGSQLDPELVRIFIGLHALDRQATSEASERASGCLAS
jgi:diguanylate cyclase (GGDEF)-like protein/PAS domain S-box-containing protein/putative nucleotidyltransferase with HDIG domain